MKKTKKIIYGGCLTALLTLILLLACKKGNQDESTNLPTSNAKESSPEIQSPNTGARGVGTQTFYSQDSAGVYYKMVLNWNSATGAVSVDRTIVTSGYPSDTPKRWFGVDPEISTTKIDRDSDTTDFDEIRICFKNGLQYYLISFAPQVAGGGPNYFGFLGNGGCTGHTCECTRGGNTPDGWGTVCKLKPWKGGQYCDGCRGCSLIHQVQLDPLGGYFVSPTGFYLVEATSITILN